ncbi:TPA: hypothetical protein JAW32_005236 [Citrobacter freundii]|nr:hypothetical protein [Citrobacter freundii]HAT7610305.1 hypothetical protein [Citrobacter freundii]
MPVLAVVLAGTGAAGSSGALSHCGSALTGLFVLSFARVFRAFTRSARSSP